MAIELNVNLQPKQKEALRMSFDTPVTFYGGARGGGKSYLIRARELIRRLKYPNTKGLIVRKTYPELLSNHIRKFFEEYPPTVNWYNKSEKVIRWPNGSITEFSYLGRTDDVYTYQGREYEDISIDELTQHEELVFKVIRASLRTTRKDVKPSMFLTGNPGGIGHGWVKRLFIDQKYRPEENNTDFAFIQAKVTDNFALMEADPEYKKRLEDLPEHLRRAYLDGDWSIFAGQMFIELRDDLHITDPEKLPTGTRYFAGYDYGYNHPFAFVLCAITPDGDYRVVSHIKKRFTRPEEQAHLMLEMLKDKGRVHIYCGHDIFDDRSGGKTIEDQLLDAGLLTSGHILQRAAIDHIQGIAELRKVFSLRPDGQPYLKFFRNTKEVFDCLLDQQIDPNKPEDVIKLNAIDGDGGDDLYDALRYAIRSWTLPQKQLQEKPANTGQRLLELAKARAKRTGDWR